MNSETKNHSRNTPQLKADSYSLISNDGKKSVNIKKGPMLTEKIQVDYNEPSDDKKKV